MASLLFTDVDWEAREVIVRPYHAKGKRERRVPADDRLWEILLRQRAGAPGRQPGTVSNPRIAALVRERFTREHVFVTTRNTPLDGSGAVLLFLRRDQAVSYQNLLRHPLMSVVGLLVAWYLFNPLLRPVLRAALHLLYR